MNYHWQRYKIFAVKLGNAYYDENNYLDAYRQYYNANEPYTKVALKYLQMARNIEVGINPGSLPYYLREEGRLMESIELIEDSIRLYDPVWEKTAITEAIRVLIPLLEKKKLTVRKRDMINRLYELNPGALQTIGFGLPLEVVNNPSDSRDSRKANKLLIRWIKKAGSEVVETPGVEGVQYRLVLQSGGNGYVLVQFINIEYSQPVWEFGFTIDRNRFRESVLELWDRIIENLYSVE